MVFSKQFDASTFCSLGGVIGVDSRGVLLSLARIREKGPSYIQNLLTSPTKSCSTSFLLQLVSSIPGKESNSSLACPDQY